MDRRPSRPFVPSWLTRLAGRRAGHGEKARTPELQSAERLLAAANEASGTARNLYITVLGFAIFLAIVTGGLTDEGLLRDSAVALPLIENVNLPLSTFYLIAPWLVVFLHGDLLLHFALLADKLHGFNAALTLLPEKEQHELRLRLGNFPFSHWLAGDRRYRRYQGLVLWSSAIALPLVVLVFAQLGFLPYHSEAVTWSNRLAVLADSALILGFWPSIVQQERSCRQWWLDVAARGWRFWLGDKRPRTGMLSLALVLLAVFVSWIVATIPDERWERLLIAAARSVGGDGVTGTNSKDGAPYTCFQSLRLNARTGFGRPQARDAMTAENKSSPALTAVLPEGLTALCSTALVFHSDIPLFRGFHRTLTVPERVLIGNAVAPEHLAPIESTDESARRAALAKAEPLDLRGRDLRWAMLRSARLYRADLRDARLQGASLLLAQLQGVRLDGAQLQGARLGRAQSRGARLDGAQLQGAMLDRAQLQGAMLDRAQLQGAELSGVTMELATLDGAHFGLLTQEVVDDIVASGEWQSIPESSRGEAKERLVSRIRKSATGMVTPETCLGTPVDFTAASCLKWGALAACRT